MLWNLKHRIKRVAQSLWRHTRSSVPGNFFAGLLRRGAVPRPEPRALQSCPAWNLLAAGSCPRSWGPS